MQGQETGHGGGMANETREGRGMGRRHGKVKASCVGRANELLPLGLRAAVAEGWRCGAGGEMHRRRTSQTQEALREIREIASRRLARRS